MYALFPSGGSVTSAHQVPAVSQSAYSPSSPDTPDSRFSTPPQTPAEQQRPSSTADDPTTHPTYRKGTYTPASEHHSVIFYMAEPDTEQHHHHHPARLKLLVDPLDSIYIYVFIFIYFI